jgi:predicted permease
MDNFKIKGQRLIALFMLGCLVFNYPVLALFNRPGTAFGIPVLYVFIFAAWILLIAMMALVVEATEQADR